MFEVAGLLVLVTMGAAVPAVDEANVMASADVPTRTADEIAALLARAKTEGRLKTARKTRPVDARPAKPGEVVVTVIRDEGKETQSRPAAEGDWVVRNRCPETGDEEYLVGAEKFRDKYRRTDAPASSGGWQEFRPVGNDVRFVILSPEAGSFRFKAPWGEWMVARPGDALVQDPQDEKDIYRVAKASFACTYEVVA